tara:strand:+ start:101 stop:271 length:171 start_codon:yes stop_codon:yes gene_type:complete
MSTKNNAHNYILAGNDNNASLRENLHHFIEAQDMFSAEDAAAILRDCLELGRPLAI